jgi:hypothetical protein
VHSESLKDTIETALREAKCQPRKLAEELAQETAAAKSASTALILQRNITKWPQDNIQNLAADILSIDRQSQPYMRHGSELDAPYTVREGLEQAHSTVNQNARKDGRINCAADESATAPAYNVETWTSNRQSPRRPLFQEESGKGNEGRVGASRGSMINPPTGPSATLYPIDPSDRHGDNEEAEPFLDRGWDPGEEGLELSDRRIGGQGWCRGLGPKHQFLKDSLLTDADVENWRRAAGFPPSVTHIGELAGCNPKDIVPTKDRSRGNMHIPPKSTTWENASQKRSSFPIESPSEGEKGKESPPPLLDNNRRSKSQKNPPHAYHRSSERASFFKRFYVHAQGPK